MCGSNKTFKMKQLTTYFDCETLPGKTKRKIIDAKYRPGWFLEWSFSGPGKSTEWSLVSYF